MHIGDCLGAKAVIFPTGKFSPVIEKSKPNEKSSVYSKYLQLLMIILWIINTATALVMSRFRIVHKQCNGSLKARSIRPIELFTYKLQAEKQTKQKRKKGMSIHLIAIRFSVRITVKIVDMHSYYYHVKLLIWPRPRHNWNNHAKHKTMITPWSRPQKR